MATGTEMDAAPPEREVVHIRRHTGRAIVKWVAIGLSAILLLFAALIVWINTDAGRRFVVRQINQLEIASGLDIQIGRIDGSLFGEMVIHDLTLADPQGIFFRAPRAELDLRPLAYLRANHVDIRYLVVPEARLHRLPELEPGDPDAPLLPDMDIDIGRLEIGRLAVDPAVTGQRHLVSLAGRVNIADRRARVDARAGTIAAPGLAGGDRLRLRLDAVPDDNQLDIAVRLEAPGDGFVAGLAGIDRPLSLAIDGEGSWAEWRGRAQARLGGEGLADLALTARDGTFNLIGPVRPGLLIEGPVERLTAPLTQVNLTATLDQRRADLRLRMNSRALAVAAEGLVDLGNNRYDNLRVAARLLEPGAIAPDLRGRDVRLNLLLDGAFATPLVGYDLQAASLDISGTILENLRATGRARVDADRIMVPVSARASRILGLDESIGGLLTNVAVDGDLAVNMPFILSDNLRIRSDRVNATAAIALDLARGNYRFALQGRVNNYLVDGVGLIDLDTNLNIVTEADGFGIRGRFAARTRRIDNAAAADFLGGQAVMSANIAMSANGVIRLDTIRLSAPQMRITSGTGTYWPDGRLDFRLAGVSNAYGPLDVHVTGTAAAPQIRLRAARPGFGIGLAGVEATVRATPRGWAIQATGQSQYGPFSADIVVLTQAGPLTIEINRLTFAGINFSGRVQQTPAGPFVGTLSMSGQGLDGTVRLSAEGRHQRADIAATANGASIPGDTPIQIQRGIIRATAILYPDAPAVVGDVQLAGLRSGDLMVQQARARVDYRGGRGQAQILAEGRSGVPFRVAANAALSPAHIRVNAQGNVNNIPFRLAQPADLRAANGGWQLAPATIVFPQGNVRLAGRFGNGTVVQSRLDNMDVAILNAFSPGLGLGGRATGSLDFAQPAGTAFPRAEARLNIENFTRTGIAVRSEAVNLAFAGSLRPEGGVAGLVIRRGGAVIGRAQARLQPLGAGAGPWMQRLMAAPLAGGIRYNGPADVLWSLAAVPGHQLRGPIGVAADFSGRVQDPQFTGVVRANSLVYENEEFGTRITNLALNGRFTGSRFEITQLAGRAGPGTVTGSGSVDLSAAAGFPIDIRLAFDNAQLARGDDLGARATGQLAITNRPGQDPLIAGELLVPEARYQVVMQGSADVPQLQGVRRRGEPVRPPNAQANGDDAVPSIWRLDLRVRAPNRMFVSGMGLESEWAMDLRVGGTSRTPQITGGLDLIRGTYSFSGRRFELREGDIAFTGSRPPNPSVSIQAVSQIDGVEVAINVSGTAANPQIAFSSTPGLPQDEIVSRILFGNSVGEISALQAVQLAASLNSLRGNGGGLNPLGALRQAGGIDRLRILGADQTTGRGTAVAAGMYIASDVYIEVITDARGFTATQLEIALSRTLSILSQFGSTGGTNVNLRYSRDY
ncbi:MAG: translocation/assembly module TamB domain-containing protein [Allosphingosinicella sp.]|uniref:translocation/assembly module TamB domain-containing protein n=1 Tax=Allosphingosinicella sp. TaxID=2823234 RepID=UPI0039457940